MEIKIDEINGKIQVTLNADEFFLCKEEDGSGYTINYKIDRSYKGKDEDVGMPVLFISAKEAEKLKSILDLLE